MGEEISTGIDKLLELIKEKGSVSLSALAKELGVSVALIEEWGYFLEERGIVKFDYKLSGTYLVAQNMSDLQIKKREKKLVKKGDKVSKDIKKTSEAIKKATVNMDDLKTKARVVVERVSKDFDHIKEDVNALQQLEEAHQMLDEEVSSLNKHFDDRVKKISESLHRGIDRYDKILSEIKGKEKSVEKNKEEISELITSEREIFKKLKQMSELSKQVQKKATVKEEDIVEDLNHINHLKNEMKNLESEMIADRKAVQQLIKDKEMKEKEIDEKSKRILKKIGIREKEIDSGKTDIKDIQDRFKNFITSKKEIKKLLKNSDSDVLTLQDELNNLIIEAEHLDSLTNSADIRKLAEKIRKEYMLVKSNRDKAHKDFKSLTKMLKV